MHKVGSVTISIPAARPVLVQSLRRGRTKRLAISLAYLCLLAGASVRLYRKPIYSMDSIQYMGNALLMEERDPARIHQRVYAEVRRFVPAADRDNLLGHRADAPDDQNKSRQQRAANSGAFAEFLPLFAIRPLYNQTLWLVSKTGLGLVRAGLLLSVAPYFLLGILVFVWLGKYMSPWLTLGFSTLLMITPPLMSMGRETTADPLATLVAFASLYLIFEKRRLLPGIVLLLASIYFRTDFVALAGPVLAVCWLERRVDWWEATVLGMLAVASVLCINHFAGDYGIGMLYYRNLSGVPITPGEMTVRLTASDYISAFRSGITLMIESFFLPFLMLGMAGLVVKRMRGLFAVTLAYVLLHFMVLPNWQERWFGVFYLSMAVCAATAMGAAEAGRFDGAPEQQIV
ncbi:MAG: hypothetical protein WBX38_05105 [Candidatus Sulfotelmatobacter sp.]